MSMTVTGIVLILLHLIVCAVFFVLIRTGRLKVRMYVMPFVVMVPFWGSMCVLLLHHHLATHEGAAEEIPMEKLRIEDVIYKSLAPENVREKSVAPLEEVLMLSPSEKRRSVMLDILNDAPEQYTGILLQARSGDDTEVVHYATTAMAEMSKRHDLEIQTYENAYAADPGNEALIREYADKLDSYLKSGMAEGRTAQIQREQLIRLLKQLQRYTHRQDDHERLIYHLIGCGRYEEALEAAEQMLRLWPGEETPWLLLIECCALSGDGERLHRSIREARDRKIYFGRQGEEKLRFWEKEDTH